jgi:DNA-binding HxlR family transcriptional regulator
MAGKQPGANRLGRNKTVSIAEFKANKVSRVRTRRRATVPEIVEDVLGCKWTIHVLLQIREGINRPGALVRTSRGLTTKVLNERLSKLVRFGVLEKASYPEIPPRVEYRFTPLGKRLNHVLDEIRHMQQDIDDGRLD